MMSGKATPAQLIISARSFYTESPPKKSRLQDNNNIRPPFKTFKDQLINFDRKLSEPIGSHGPKEPDQIITITATTDDNNEGESKNLDRDSPIPLKNLGNTCYENSIIQCLFSLEMFMDNFERSMERARNFVVKSKTTLPGSADDGAEINMDQQQIVDTTSKEPIISEEDVRFRIANAFDNLYKCYIQKRNQAETPASDQISSCADDEQRKQQYESNQQAKKEPETSLSNQPSTSDPSSSRATQNLTPIALVSSTTLPSEQLEIETRLEELKSAVGERSSQFNSTHQQDASEFFYHVIDSIQEFYQGLNKNDENDNPVTKAFELELDYLIKCPKCHHKIISDPEKIRTLPLALPHVEPENSSANCSDDYNLDINRIPTPPTSDLGLDSPESCATEDTRNGSDEKENQALSGNISSTKVINSDDNEGKVSNPMSGPEVIAMQPEIQRTQTKPNYTLCDALNNYFKDDVLEYKCSQPNCDSAQRTKKCLIRKLPQILFITLARYSYTGKKNLDEIEAPFDLKVPFQENKSPSHSSSSRYSNDSDDKYQLVAVVCHLGSSLNAGHYTSYVYNQNNQSWYSCDDDSISKVHENDVKSNASKSGYCFFYAHQSCIAKKPDSNRQSVNQNHHGQSHENDTTDTFMIDSSTILTPESSPSPTSLSQDYSSFNSDVMIMNVSDRTAEDKSTHFM